MQINHLQEEVFYKTHSNLFHLDCVHKRHKAHCLQAVQKLQVFH